MAAHVHLEVKVGVQRQQQRVPRARRSRWLSATPRHRHRHATDVAKASAKLARPGRPVPTQRALPLSVDIGHPAALRSTPASAVHGRFALRGPDVGTAARGPFPAHRRCADLCVLVSLPRRSLCLQGDRAAAGCAVWPAWRRSKS